MIVAAALQGGLLVIVWRWWGDRSWCRSCVCNEDSRYSRWEVRCVGCNVVCVARGFSVFFFCFFFCLFERIPRLNQVYVYRILNSEPWTNRGNGWTSLTLVLHRTGNSRFIMPWNGSLRWMLIGPVTRASVWPYFRMIRCRCNGSTWRIE